MKTRFRYDPEALGFKALSSGWRTVRDALWPPKSLVTNAHITGPGLIEAHFWTDMTFCVPPLCDRCGTLFEIATPEVQICAACMARPPVFDRARAALVYGDISRKLVMDLKHGGRRDGLALMARWMHNAAADLLDTCDMLVPVPLHYRRFIRRGFNQSVWLAAALHRLTGLPLRRSILQRVRATPSQGGKSARGRIRNVVGAFLVRQTQDVQNRRILLVDDVMTTGATLNACARALKKAGAKSVDALTLTRVDRPADAGIG